MGCGAAMALSTASAAGQSTAERAPEVVREATALFTSGSELYRKKSYGEALDALQRSHALVPSPNSALFVARCLRELGRTVEAVAEFAEVEREAAADAAGSDGRYAETAKAAASEAADLRGELGTINVHTRHLPPGGVVLVDGAPVTLKDDGYQAYHAPGGVTVTFRAPPAPDVVRAVRLRAGAQFDVDLDLAPVALPPPAPARPGWLVPAVVAAGGLGVVGIAMSIGFGVSSRATFNDLQSTCGSRCTSAAQQDEIASGKRNQTISNVSLGIGLVGAAVGGVVLWMGLSTRAPVTSLEVGPARVSLGGRF